MPYLEHLDVPRESPVGDARESRAHELQRGVFSALGQFEIDAPQGGFQYVAGIGNQTRYITERPFYVGHGDAERFAIGGLVEPDYLNCRDLSTDKIPDVYPGTTDLTPNEPIWPGRQGFVSPDTHFTQYGYPKCMGGAYMSAPTEGERMAVRFRVYGLFQNASGQTRRQGTEFNPIVPSFRITEKSPSGFAYEQDNFLQFYSVYQRELFALSYLPETMGAPVFLVVRSGFGTTVHYEKTVLLNPAHSSAVTVNEYDYSGVVDIECPLESTITCHAFALIPFRRGLNSNDIWLPVAQLEPWYRALVSMQPAGQSVNPERPVNFSGQWLRVICDAVEVG